MMMMHDDDDDDAWWWSMMMINYDDDDDNDNDNEDDDDDDFVHFDVFYVVACWVNLVQSSCFPSKETQTDDKQAQNLHPEEPTHRRHEIHDVGPVVACKTPNMRRKKKISLLFLLNWRKNLPVLKWQ